MIRLPGQIAGPDPHEAVRERLAEELTALLAVPLDSTPEHERRDLLSDLNSRLAALLTTPAVSSHPERYRLLTTLSGSLAACDRPNPPRGAELETLWATAVATLTTLTSGSGDDTPASPPTPPADPEPPRRRAFWKRNG